MDEANDCIELYEKYQNIDIPVEYLSLFETVILNLDDVRFKIIMEGIIEFGFDPSCFNPNSKDLLEAFTPSKRKDVIEETISKITTYIAENRAQN